jgi:16S rRNA (guanine966-N2)-methyltransferase
VVVEAAARSEAPPWPPGLVPERPRRYGDTSLHVATFGTGRLEPTPE